MSSSPYNKFTAGLTAKYNWPTYQTYPPSFVYNMFDVRPEIRYYFRTKKRDVPANPEQLSSWKEERSHRSFGRKIDDFLRDRNDPNPSRAYYIGPYLNYNNWSFLIAGNGIQGDAAGIGLSYGFGVPLYEYVQGAVDVEFGFSVGFYMSRFDKFTYNDDDYKYVPLPPDNKTNWHFTPFPVVSELRVSFAYRQKSIKNKYNLDNPEKALMKQAITDIRITFSTTDRTNFDASVTSIITRDEYAENDSLYRAAFVEYVDGTVEKELSKNTPESRPKLSEKNLKKLEKLIYSLGKETIKAFDKSMIEEGRTVYSDKKRGKARKSKKEKKSDIDIEDKVDENE